MGKRGPKPQFTDVACSNHSCKSYGLTGEGNIVGNGTSVSRGEKVRKYICRHCGKVFNDQTVILLTRWLLTMELFQL